MGDESCNPDDSAQLALAETVGLIFAEGAAGSTEMLKELDEFILVAQSPEVVSRRQEILAISGDYTTLVSEQDELVNKTYRVVHAMHMFKQHGLALAKNAANKACESDDEEPLYDVSGTIVSKFRPEAAARGWLNAYAKCSEEDRIKLAGELSRTIDRWSSLARKMKDEIDYWEKELELSAATKKECQSCIGKLHARIQNLTAGAILLGVVAAMCSAASGPLLAAGAVVAVGAGIVLAGFAALSWGMKRETMKQLKDVELQEAARKDVKQKAGAAVMDAERVVHVLKTVMRNVVAAQKQAEDLRAQAESVGITKKRTKDSLEEAEDIVVPSVPSMSELAEMCPVPDRVNSFFDEQRKRDADAWRARIEVWESDVIGLHAAKKAIKRFETSLQQHHQAEYKKTLQAFEESIPRRAVKLGKE